MFWGVYRNWPVRPCVRVCVQNTSFCHSAGGGIKLHLVMSLHDFIQEMQKGRSDSKKQTFY